MRFASISAEANPSLQNSAGPKRAWLDQWKLMGELIIEAVLGLELSWIRCQDEIGYLEQLLNIIRRFCHIREPFNFRTASSFVGSPLRPESLLSCAGTLHGSRLCSAPSPWTKRVPINALPKLKEIFSGAASLCSALYS